MADTDPDRFVNPRSVITIRHGGFEFIPEFVHQLFKNERIYGYELLDDQEDFEEIAEGDDDAEEVPYDTVLNEVDTGVRIIIELSPDCQSAQVEVKEETLFTGDNNDGDNNDGDNNDDNNYDSDNNGSTAEPARKRIKIENEREKRTTEISAIVRKALPPLGSECGTLDLSALGAVSKIGENQVLIHSQPSENSAAEKFFKKVEPLSLWLIETASTVDISSTKDGGRWEILFLFESGAFVGYCTLFFFNALFRRPKPGIVVRICQMIIMPRFQRRGLGRKLMREVYELASASEKIVEITVEDPCIGFTLLRNNIDYSLFKERGLFERLGGLSSKGFQSLPSDVSEKIATELKITRGQVDICYEIHKFQSVKHHENLRDPENTDQDCKAFRILVKRRLNRLHAETILGFGDDKERKKKFLADCFNECEENYRKTKT